MDLLIRAKEVVGSIPSAIMFMDQLDNLTLDDFESFYDEFIAPLNLQTVQDCKDNFLWMIEEHLNNYMSDDVIEELLSILKEYANKKSLHS